MGVVFECYFCGCKFDGEGYRMAPWVRVFACPKCTEGAKPDYLRQHEEMQTKLMGAVGDVAESEGE